MCRIKKDCRDGREGGEGGKTEKKKKKEQKKQKTGSLSSLFAAGLSASLSGIAVSDGTSHGSLCDWQRRGSMDVNVTERAALATQADRQADR